MRQRLYGCHNRNLCNCVGQHLLLLHRASGNCVSQHFSVASQGYWPDGIYTAPSDAALKYDIEVSKQMGFNMLRKHIKVEPDRCTTVPSFSCSSAFCCCCLNVFCSSSLHTSRWRLTDTKQNMSSKKKQNMLSKKKRNTRPCCSLHLCGQHTVHKSCAKADTCHSCSLFLFFHLFVHCFELLALCIQHRHQQGFSFKQLCLQCICLSTYQYPVHLFYTALNISTL